MLSETGTWYVAWQAIMLAVRGIAAFRFCLLEEKYYVFYVTRLFQGAINVDALNTDDQNDEREETGPLQRTC